MNNQNINETEHLTESADRTSRGASRARWAAVGAAIAVALGGGGVGFVHATVSEGERPVLVSIEPCRLVDTRADSQVGPRSSPIGTAEQYDVNAHGANGNCTIPATASGLSLNVTALNATAPTNVRIYAADAALPTTSNLNPNPGTPPVPNSVTTDLDAAGMFTVYNDFGTVDVIVDVNGYYEDHNHDDRYVQLGDYEDHNHDDRYVQLDDVMWAVVDGDGTLERASDGVVSAELLDGAVPSGDYAVVFERDISGCAYQATAGRPGVNTAPLPGFAQVANWIDDPTNGVIVFVKDQDGAGVENRGFHLTVTC